MNVLLTGVTSFVGRHVALALASAGYAIAGTYRTADPTLDRLQAAGIRLVDLDLTDPASFERLHGSFHAVVHVAGQSTPGPAPFGGIVDVNVLGTSNLIRFCDRAGVRKVVFASTMSVYGRPAGGSTVDEVTPTATPDVYGASKLLAERLLAETGRPCAALRLPGVLGAGAHRAWLPTLAERMVAGGNVTIYNPAQPFNNGVHVADLGRFIDRLLRTDWTGFHAFPVGAAGVTTAGNAVRVLMEALGVEVGVEAVESPHGNFLISSDFATRMFGYEPMDIESMIRRYADEVRSHQIPWN